MDSDGDDEKHDFRIVQLTEPDATPWTQNQTEEVSERVKLAADVQESKPQVTEMVQKERFNLESGSANITDE